MLQFQVASDLHIEFMRDSIPNPLDYITPTTDILILAGDIGSFYKQEQLNGFIRKTCEYFSLVIYVVGNHEYYKQRFHQPLPIEEIENRIKILESSIENLYILDRNKEPLLIDNVCIAGCTLWSDPKVRIPNFFKIHGMNTNLYRNRFQKDLLYIQRVMKHCKKKKLKLLVVTHYLPTYRVIEERLSDEYVSLYASNLDHLLEEGTVHTWISGHVHKNFDLTYSSGTRFVGNQCGKTKDNIPDFRKDFVISV